MAYTSIIKSYTIDLTQKQKHRWAEVIAAEINTAQRLIKHSKDDLVFLKKLLLYLLKSPFQIAYEYSGGLYIKEMEAWADEIDISLSDVVVMNCQYELSHLGCTAAIVYNKTKGFVHIRNMDWPLKGLGKATRIFRFKKGRREFITIGVPGQIGVLSGMLPKAYSVTINWAPVDKSPWFDGYGPLFLLRKVFEKCDTFDEAVDELENNNLATNCFFLVSGIKKDEACVIERTKDRSSVRYIAGNYLTVANHFKARKFRDINNDEEMLEDSIEREAALENKIKKLSPMASLETIANCLDVEPTLNFYTYQQMLFISKTGEFKVWRWV